MNTILILCDTLRRDHLGCYGNPWIKTPDLDRLAAMGTVFDNHYCASFPTLPCRRDILTGKIEFPWRGWGGLEPNDATLSALFTQAGRISYFITDIYHHWGRDAGNYWADFSGFELIRGEERDNYVTDADIEIREPAPGLNQPKNIGPHLRNVAKIRHNEEDWFAPQVFTRAGQWLQHNYRHNDFFLMVDGFDPHEPWDPPRYYTDLYDDPAYDGPEYINCQYRAIEGYLSPREFKHVQALYAGQVTMVDRWVGHVLDQAEILGLLKNTVILFSTDHGAYNGDHGQVGKLQTHMYQGISHIPLIVYHPEFGHGERRSHLTQPVDFYPTICESAGLPAPGALHGKSLLPILRDAGAPAIRDAAIFGRHVYTCNVTDGRHALYQSADPSLPPIYSYSHIVPKWNSGDWGPYENGRRLVGPGDSKKGLRGAPALFDLVGDPAEATDLAGREPAEVERMRRLLARQLREIHAPEEYLVRHGLHLF